MGKARQRRTPARHSKRSQHPSSRKHCARSQRAQLCVRPKSGRLRISAFPAKNHPGYLEIEANPSLALRPNAKVVVVGYADTREPKASSLAARRAELVTHFLGEKGVDASRHLHARRRSQQGDRFREAESPHRGRVCSRRSGLLSAINRQDARTYQATTRTLRDSSRRVYFFLG